ncbi:uncharacterized protein EV420DRAFT_1549887 [Desarmillaria tabescens]|uniref:DUF6534 domain-containing protein n=1 Tax=Armillaria tabescens TaxID=1929756 RepID=A0AA39N4L8_ARMTA|nr:uncharacterized protein EV420DRAFT_1549887 [Desarmillaria tabescens]KAK0457278.1 hypothetical protein EV420DRAFT_1549887 [Desarmillaria tabescens]
MKAFFEASILAPQMSSPPTPIPIFDLRSRLGTTLGAVLVGCIIASVFYGITILQTVAYYKQYPNDQWIFRYAVALLWIFDTLHVALTTHALYFYVIESFGNYLALLTIVWSFSLQLLINMLIIPGVQALYAFRIWKLGSHFHVVLPRFIFVAVAATFGAGLYVMYETYTLTSFLDISTIRVSIYLNFSTISAADFVIAGAMCFYLHKGRSMAGVSSTTKVIMRLMRLVVISGLATSACSLFTLVAYIAWPNTLIFVAINFILPRLYINSLLAMLNSRKSSMDNKECHSDEKTIRFVSPATGSGATDSGQTNITISDPSVA